MQALFPAAINAARRQPVPDWLKDIIFIAAGIGVFALFAAYAVGLRRI